MRKGFYGRLALRNLKNHRQVYLPYLASSVGVVMMFYIICSLRVGVESADMYGQRTTGVIMGLGSYVIGIFSVLFLFYTNSFIMKRRKKELGLYNILGMEKRHIAKVVLMETLITSLTAILLGLGLGILFSRAMYLLLDKIMHSTSPIPFVIPGIAVGATAALFLAIFFITACYNLLQVKLSKPIELLHGGEVGEKEPKAHWLLAVLGILLLGGGYYLAVTIQDPIEALMWFFIAVILVILGTYLLFITGITAMLKLLKKNKRFYYKANHFTAVSGMLYRMKQNAAGLASICILFTCLLVTVSTTFSLYTGTEATLAARYPRDIMIDGTNVSEGARELVRQTAAEECEKQGAAPENLWERSYYQWVLRREGKDFYPNGDGTSFTYATFDIYTQEEYNRFSGENLKLEPNQVLLCDPRGTYQESEMVFHGAKDDKTYEVLRPEEDFSGGVLAAVMYDVYYLVIPDKSLFETVLTAVEDGALWTELNPEHWAFYFDVDLPGPAIQELDMAINAAVPEKAVAGKAQDVTYESLGTENAYSNREDIFALYGGLFFLGLFLGTLFLLGTALIIYYKQVSEGYEDARRFQIMQQVGMSRKEVKRSIHSQILLVFFLPLLTAVLHLGFAFPMLQKILLLMNIINFPLILGSAIGCVLVFGLIYAIVYLITARTYTKLVESGAD